MTALPPPFDRELLVFVGKGGVGKTTIASAVALRSARAGRRTLLVTVDPAQRLEDALGVPVSHQVKAVHGKLHAMMLDPEKVLQDYLREVAPDRDLSSHPLYKYISNYLPGLNELLAIGKLIEFRREKDFDTIVIDTAPTGHALSFLTTPVKVRDLLRESVLLKWALRGYGLYKKLSKGGRALQGIFLGRDRLPEIPDVDFEATLERISQHVGEIHELLQDSKRTSLSLVTLPEKLPVEETLDLHRYLTKELGIGVASLIVNKVAPDPLGPAAKAFRRFLVDDDARTEIEDTLDRQGYPRALLRGLMDTVQFDEMRRGMNDLYVAKLQADLPAIPQLHVPLQREDVHGLDRLQEIEERLFAPTELVQPRPPA